MRETRETWVQSLGQEDPLEKEMATHSSIHVWEIPWTEKPAGNSPWGRKESDTSERLHFSLLNKVHASVFMNMEPSLFLPLIEQHVNPRVWADGKSMGRAQNAIPVVVKLKDLHLFPQKKQHPLKPEAKEGLKPIIEKLKGQRLLIPCNSPCNTPIWGIKKSNGKWRLDLQIINEAVVPLHPVVPNPFILLSEIPN